MQDNTNATHLCVCAMLHLAYPGCRCDGTVQANIRHTTYLQHTTDPTHRNRGSNNNGSGPDPKESLLQEGLDEGRGPL